MKMTKAAYQAALTEHMRAAGRLGGPARAKALSATRRANIASMGGLALRDRHTPEERSARMRRAWVTRRKGGLAKAAKARGKG